MRRKDDPVQYMIESVPSPGRYTLCLPNGAKANDGKVIEEKDMPQGLMTCTGGCKGTGTCSGCEDGRKNCKWCFNLKKCHVCKGAGIIPSMCTNCGKKGVTTDTCDGAKKCWTRNWSKKANLANV